MREPIENISLLQKQINNLQFENQILKSILYRSGISYIHEIARSGEPEEAEGYDPDLFSSFRTEGMELRRSYEEYFGEQLELL